ncbi:hypothetical protein SEA_BAILEYBLU_51 [Arthrobacter phage BaileyBlu]|uniref:Uncharacterized protein n=1 Tax=Arthrobacter phage BaileyBlu TaxID=2910754 RepID=A0AA49BNJ6_9CAUD|nr:hypothetical protein PQD78_gp51 [Arthrobacter phage BaileyBlu]UJQ87189.1 hypothetical protein SEA_BAILEYBLU_51 [Arthrobacter phage BaileyBlu]
MIHDPMDTVLKFTATDADGDEIQIVDPKPTTDPDVVAYVKTARVGAHLTTAQAKEAARVLLALADGTGNAVVDLPPVLVQHSEYPDFAPLYQSGGTLRRINSPAKIAEEEARALEVIAIAHAARRVEAEEAAREAREAEEARQRAEAEERNRRAREANLARQDHEEKVSKLAYEIYRLADEPNGPWHTLSPATSAFYVASARAALDFAKAHA